MPTLLRLVAACSLSILAAIPARPADSPRAALDARAAELRAELGREFTVVVEAPFVVAGDEPAAVVRERCRATIRWAVTRLKRAYFARDPEEVITIWLFRDRSSYEDTLRERFGETSVSPYGFYSRRHRALFMNISTGNGTLVHEIVHPFIRANFPACPAWFNEGLASLYEQCADEDGTIVGRVNWRLPGLQERIRAGQTRPFAELMAMTPTEFYGEADGYSVHYGQARYLCFYLQERGLLQTYYRAFVAGVAEDPSGLATLQRVVGITDMVGFQRDWEAFVLRRRFPE